MRDRNSIRNRILRRVHERAAELLAERGERPLPTRVTPHTYRRSYLTYLAWAGRPERYAMHQAGHRRSSLTLEIYQQPFPTGPRAERERELILRWLGD